MAELYPSHSAQVANTDTNGTTAVDFLGSTKDFFCRKRLLCWSLRSLVENSARQWSTKPRTRHDITEYINVVKPQTECDYRVLSPSIANLLLHICDFLKYWGCVQKLSLTTVHLTQTVHVDGKATYGIMSFSLRARFSWQSYSHAIRGCTSLFLLLGHGHSHELQRIHLRIQRSELLLHV